MTIFRIREAFTVILLFNVMVSCGSPSAGQRKALKVEPLQKAIPSPANPGLDEGRFTFDPVSQGLVCSRPALRAAVRFAEADSGVGFSDWATGAGLSLIERGFRFNFGTTQMVADRFSAAFQVNSGESVLVHIIASEIPGTGGCSIWKVERSL